MASEPEELTQYTKDKLEDLARRLKAKKVSAAQYAREMDAILGEDPEPDKGAEAAFEGARRARERGQD